MSKMALCGDEYRDGAQRTEPRVSAFLKCRAVTRRITCCEDDQLPQLLGGRIFHIKEGWMAEQRSGAMENRKIKVKSLISVTAWVVALGMFIAYLFLKRQWMLFTIDFAILLSCLLGISDPEEDRREQECILDPSHYPCDGYCDTSDVRTGFVRIDAAFGTEEYRVFAFGTK